MIYFVSDLHFFHRKMGEYCGRPDNFEELIFEGLKSIPKEDQLICLGDVCIGRDREAHERFIMPLQCKKTLIMGNHDKKTVTWYKAHGWNEVEKRMVISAGGKRILLTHEPDQFLSDIHYNVHGHLHNHLERILAKQFVIEGEENRNAGWLAYYNPEKHKLISMEALDYKPISINDLLGL